MSLGNLRMLFRTLSFQRVNRSCGHNNTSFDRRNTKIPSKEQKPFELLVSRHVCSNSNLFDRVICFLKIFSSFFLLHKCTYIYFVGIFFVLVNKQKYTWHQKCNNIRIYFPPKSMIGKKLYNMSSFLQLLGTIQNTPKFQ